MRASLLISSLVVSSFPYFRLSHGQNLQQFQKGLSSMGTRCYYKRPKEFVIQPSRERTEAQLTARLSLARPQSERCQFLHERLHVCYLLFVTLGLRGHC
jgi:hypothetical protein